MSPTRLSNYGPYRGLRARPVRRPEIQTICAFSGLDWAAQIYTYTHVPPTHIEMHTNFFENSFFIIF
jgi:hypothetical protein